MTSKDSATHGAFLVDMIEQVDNLIEEASSSGSLAVLDAISTAAMLKALVRGDRSFDPKERLVLARRERFRRGTKLAMLDFNYGWAPAVEPTEEPEQNE